ncbi:16S rRNA (adenine(1518)-N(6)/adenine(1519)-N(6))-dimethyltransferase RsmA [Cohnella cholangitidis]|uniref:Ribosomal RNA small subunit methyltransferase A n=1 Tax=Cohnella cholangitidis TaxID=2598458 RepID=A0A7G5BZ34_9BACL|nr:16S rRNA (adenine(1518)-N(6)/adenine(1519)-N(6))-dimethyltransferase RsmA [Cohnella cholangitidis]QMV42218.1 16S rRNA (adenine(1518)-N(6)/adenine(1519)-N(6))-dimethyltransferase RsmA [Cohnella cholangitidis]
MKKTTDKNGGAKKYGPHTKPYQYYKSSKPEGAAAKPASGIGSNEILKEIATSSRTRDIIRKHGFTFKKSLGQNFLINSDVLDQIIAAAGLDETRGALEVGPGIGSLTERLAKAAGKVASVEIDKRLLPILEDVLSPYENVNVVHSDILKTDLQQLWKEQFSGLAGVSVVANLPYYVTTPIIMKLLEERLPLENIVVMVQKEVALRMAAKPGGKDFGSLSIAVQYYCEPELVCIVPGKAFIPAPNVESAVIKLKRRLEPAVSVPDEAKFFQVVQTAFAQRRKTLANNLAALSGKDRKGELADLLLACDIKPERRAETLSLQEFARVCDALTRSGMLV